MGAGGFPMVEVSAPYTTPILPQVHEVYKGTTSVVRVHTSAYG